MLPFYLSDTAQLLAGHHESTRGALVQYAGYGIATERSRRSTISLPSSPSLLAACNR